MKDHTGCSREFIQLSRAWYGGTSLFLMSEREEIIIGFYDDNEGGTTGEFSIYWVDLGGELVPELRAFNDSWSALWNFRDLLEKLAEIDGSTPSPSEMCNILLSLGIKDATPMERK